MRRRLKLWRLCRASSRRPQASRGGGGGVAGTLGLGRGSSRKGRARPAPCAPGKRGRGRRAAPPPASSSGAVVRLPGRDEFVCVCGVCAERCGEGRERLGLPRREREPRLSSAEQRPRDGIASRSPGAPRVPLRGSGAAGSVREALRAKYRVGTACGVGARACRSAALLRKSRKAVKLCGPQKSCGERTGKIV